MKNGWPNIPGCFDSYRTKSVFERMQRNGYHRSPKSAQTIVTTTTPITIDLILWLQQDSSVHWLLHKPLNLAAIDVHCKDKLK